MKRGGIAIETIVAIGRTGMDVNKPLALIVDHNRHTILSSSDSTGRMSSR